MDISLQGGYAPPLVGVRNADSPHIKTTPTSDFSSVHQPVNHNYQAVIDRAEAQRFDGVRKASAAAARDLYPLGDKSFTIYKDKSGQYITRYVSLRDGTVTYYPEPQLVQQTHQPDLKPMVQIKV